MPSFARPVALVFALMMTFVFASSAVADQPSTAEALQYIRAGNDAFDAGEYEEAYENYMAAHDILPEQAIRYRLGQSAMNLGWARLAVYHFERFLEESEDAERLARVEEWLPELRENMPGILTVTAEPEGALVVLVTEEGETNLGRAPGEFEVGPGTVRLRARMPGFEAAGWERDVTPDERMEWNPRLAPSEPVAVEPPAERSALAMAGYASAGVGVAALAAGGVFTVLQMQATNQVNTYDKQGDGASPAELQELKDSAMGYYRLGTASFIAGGVLTAAGVGLIVFDRMQGDQDRLTLRMGVHGDGGFVTLGGRF